MSILTHLKTRDELVGVKNVVTTIEREVVLRYTRAVKFEDRLKLYSAMVD